MRYTCETCAKEVGVIYYDRSMDTWDCVKCYDKKETKASK